MFQWPISSRIRCQDIWSVHISIIDPFALSLMTELWHHTPPLAVLTSPSSCWMGALILKCKSDKTQPPSFSFKTLQGCSIKINLSSLEYLGSFLNLSVPLEYLGSFLSLSVPFLELWVSGVLSCCSRCFMLPWEQSAGAVLAGLSLPSYCLCLHRLLPVGTSPCSPPPPFMPVFSICHAFVASTEQALLCVALDV